MDAKVDAEVIKSYVKNSPTAYNPSVTEIIALKDHGVAPEVLTAMLQRGAEVRAQSMQAAQAAPNAAALQISPGAVNPYALAPGYDYGAQSVYPNYPNYTYSYPAYSYDYPSYAYGYPAYGFGYSWPFCSFGFGSYPYGGFCGYPYASYGWRYPYHYGARGFVRWPWRRRLRWSRRWPRSLNRAPDRCLLQGGLMPSGAGSTVVASVFGEAERPHGDSFLRT